MMNFITVEEQMVAMINEAETKRLKKIIYDRFYDYRYDLLRIFYDLSNLIKRLEADLDYNLPNTSIDFVTNSSGTTIKIYKDYIDLKLFKCFSTLSTTIHTIRFYKSYFCIDPEYNSNKKSTYEDLLGVINKFYKLKQRSIAYSLDALYSGLYIWFFNIQIRIGGEVCPSKYNYVVPTKIGLGIVLPNLMYWHTPFKQFENIK